MLINVVSLFQVLTSPEQYSTGVDQLFSSLVLPLKFCLCYGLFNHIQTDFIWFWYRLGRAIYSNVQ